MNKKGIEISLKALVGIVIVLGAVLLFLSVGSDLIKSAFQKGNPDDIALGSFNGIAIAFNELEGDVKNTNVFVNLEDNYYMVGLEEQGDFGVEHKLCLCKDELCDNKLKCSSFSNEIKSHDSEIIKIQGTGKIMQIYLSKEVDVYYLDLKEQKVEEPETQEKVVVEEEKSQGI